MKMHLKSGMVAIAISGVMGLGMGMPTPTVGETISQVSRQEALAEAERLTQQTFKLYKEGKYNEAIPLAEKALTIHKKQLGDNHPDTATSLNNLASLYESQGKYTAAEPLFKEALAISKKDNHPLTATSLNNLARLYESQGKYTAAEPLYKEALAISKKQLGNNHPNTATILNNLASLYESQGKYTAAEPLLKEALAIHKKQLGDNHSLTATSLNNLAVFYIYQGRYTAAEPLLEEALAIRKKQLGDNHPDTAISLNNLAGFYKDRGRYTAAEPLLKEALAIHEKQLGDNHPATANNLNNLASLYESQGRYTDAEPLYKQAIEIVKKQLGDNHPATANNLNNLAGLYSSQGRYADAESLYKQAIEIVKKQLGDNHPATANSLNNLAEFYRSQGKYTAAEPLYKQALSIRKKQLGDNHPATANSLNNLAVFYSFQGKYTAAEPLYKQAIAIVKKQLGNNHPNTATSLTNLALLYNSQGDIVRAIEYLTQGIEVQEVNLSQNLIAGDEKQKQDFIATISGTTDGIISLNLQSALNNPEANRLALKTILQRKGRILDISTNSLQILRQRIDDPQSQELLTQLIDIRTQSANLTFKKVKVTDIKSLEINRQLLPELADRAKKLEGEIGKRSATFRNLSQPITLESIQKSIPADSALVEIVRYRPFNTKAKKDIEKFGNPHYAVYILYPNGDIKTKDLGLAKPINDDLAYFRQNLRDANKEAIPQTPIPQLQASARQLDAKLMQPIRKLLGNTRNILLSPDAALNLIPFEALVDENNQYLIKNYHITYLTSGRDLLRLKDKSPSQQPPMIVADPIYNQAAEFTATTPKNAAPTRSVDLTTRKFDRLDQTAEEARAVQKLFSLPDSRVLLGKQATETALKQVKSPEFLTIATHGFFFDATESKSEPNPLLRSGLVFAGFKVGQSGGDDGILTALETTTLNLVGTKLVVLSACDTGVGDITTGEGIYGLRRALVIAGSESQLISLWKVSSAATKDLMIAYFGRLKHRKGRSEALREIQLEMLKSKNHKHPFFWASFIPSGDWTPMEFSSTK